MMVRELRVWLSRQSPELPVEIAVWQSPNQVELVQDIVVETVERDGHWVVRVDVKLYNEEPEP
jgi:hypothetical protein